MKAVSDEGGCIVYFKNTDKARDLARWTASAEILHNGGSDVLTMRCRFR